MNNTIKKENKTVTTIPVKKKTKFNSNDIRVYSLGGLGVVGMNMYVVEFDDELFIMDAGILFAHSDTHGVDYIIPDFSYLIENEKKIVGLFITHGHEDHIGALPFLLEKVKIPTIYASGIAIGLILSKMSEYPKIKFNITKFNSDSEYTFKNCKISFFHTNHSIPDSYGIAFKTKYGNIVNTGDFKFDFTPIGAKSDYYKMTKLGNEGVLCLMADSTNSDIDAFSLSERQVAQNISNLFATIKGRILIATFASNVFRIQHILEASEKYNRRVVLFGHSMVKSIEAAVKMKYFNVPKGLIISTREMHNYPPEEITILCTGSQGEPMAALSRIANGTHKQIKLLPGDTIIYSSKPIPGNEQFINRNINNLIKNGANVIRNNPLTDTHTTGHASVNEMKMMLSFMNPKYFIPVHGEYAMLKRHTKIAIDIGVKAENCFVLKPGDVVNFNEKGGKVIKEAVFTSDVYLDSSLSDVSSNVIKERKRLADEGLISIVFTIDKNKNKLSPTTIAPKGFVDEMKSSNLLNDIKTEADRLFDLGIAKYKHLNVIALRNQITMQLSQYIFDKIHRRPFIVLVINII